MLLAALLATAQTISTHCQAEEVKVANSTVDLRLVGCGEGFPDNLLWHLDRADSLDGSLDGKTTRRLTGKGAVVYMVDTGVMRDHDEFARAEGSAVIGAITSNGIGKDCPAGRNPALDPCWDNDPTLSIFTHGTATASMVAGKNVGVAPDAKIVSVYAETVGTNLDLWVAMFDAIIRHAWDPATPQFKTGIINMSFVPANASPDDTRLPKFEKKMREMIAGVDANGNPDPAGKYFLFVTVAGNHVEGFGDSCGPNLSSNLYPAVLGATIDGLITVGGIDQTNHIWERSCRGEAVDILAPSSNLLVASISAHDHYRSGKLSGSSAYPSNSGTSYAAPFVAGLAALLLEENPDLTPAELERRIKSTASHVANADEPTAAGRVAIFGDLVSSLPRRRVARP